jgi:hypothetical protein
MDPLKACYVTAGEDPSQREAVALKAAAFTPNSKVDMALDGQLLPEASGANGLQTDATGALGAMSPLSLPAPFVAKGNRDFTITLTEQGNPANTVTATSKATALALGVKPKSAKPSKRIRFRGTGFTKAGRVYAHYIFRNKVRRTVRMAKPSGPCGDWEAHKPQIPVPHPKTGLWTVQFDQSRKFVAPPNVPSVYVRLTISVTRVFPR